jgi:hypothetical protein
LLQGPFATAADLIAASEAGELTHCTAGWGAQGYDSSWASTARLTTEAARAAAAAAAAAQAADAELEGGSAGAGCFLAVSELVLSYSRGRAGGRSMYSWGSIALSGWSVCCVDGAGLLMHQMCGWVQ